MNKILAAIACLLVSGGIAFAEEKIKVVIPQPKVGVALPNIRPLAGRYYWNHPHYGWGYWYYPTPAIAVPANYYLDQYGRIVPNGYAYDPTGSLVVLEVVQAETPYYTYPYRYHNGRWRWGR